MTVLRVVQRRGGVVESIHPMSAALVGLDGAIGRIGHAEPVTWRSAAKPFQLEVSLECIGQEFPEAWLAVGASSHQAEPEHLAVVEQILGRHGVSSDVLRCGAHWPTSVMASQDLVRRGMQPTALHNNCSGKHAFMALACQAQGWSPDYLDPLHPLQLRIAARIAERTGETPITVIDGCGAPCFVLSLAGMARAWSQLALAVAKQDGILGRIGAAMRACPGLMSGVGATDGGIIRSSGGQVIAKIGAEGLLCLAVPGAGVGIALKCWSGRSEPRLPAALALLERWFPGMVDARDFESERIVRNWAGVECGEWAAEWLPTE